MVNNRLPELRTRLRLRFRSLIVLMNSVGEWQDRYDISDPERVVTGATLQLPPVFYGEVFLRDGFWTGSLNGERIAGYPTIAMAKACIDHTVWNRLRQIREAYARVLARRSSWEKGWQ